MESADVFLCIFCTDFGGEICGINVNMVQYNNKQSFFVSVWGFVDADPFWVCFC